MASLKDLGKKAKEALRSKEGRILAPALGGAFGGTQATIIANTSSSKKDDSAAKADAKALSDRYEGERSDTRKSLEKLATQSAPKIESGIADPFWMERQKTLVGDLEARARGEGPSISQMQFQQASNTALQKSLGAIRAATGANPALAGRTAALASTNLMGNLAAESGMARLKEQQDAQTALANLLAQGQAGSLNTRAQDLGVQEANAKLAANQQAFQAGIQSGLLNETNQFFGGIYDRGRMAQRPGGDDNGLLRTLIPAAATVAGGAFGGPGGAAAGNTAGTVAAEAAMPTDPATGKQGPFRLAGQTAQPRYPMNTRLRR